MLQTTTHYMVNPSILMPPPQTTIMPFPRKREQSSSPEASEEEEEYQPGPSTKRAKKVPSGSGGGSGKGTKMSREALRKANHSLIERRRREKINFALGELRGMVPGLGDEKGGKAGEFKLEVLERTVEHMKDLKAEIIELEAKVAALGGNKKSTGVKRSTGLQEEHRSKQRKTTTASTTPPSPSLSPERQPRQSLISESPDPNETESEAGLPPPLTVASRSSSHPSITSLLNSSNHAHSQGQHVYRPTAPPEAANPTLYLPFPTPSPTSPFLTYSASNTSTSTAMEPSPFIAPLNNFSLFGGAISFDPNSPEVSMGINRPPPELSMPPPKGGEKEKRIPSPEEAANLLLAFSSPDTLRPVHGGTPVFAPAVAGRRATLDSDDFMLDGGGRGGAQIARGHGHGQWSRGMVGKTAKDFLRM